MAGRRLIPALLALMFAGGCVVTAKDNGKFFAKFSQGFEFGHETATTKSTSESTLTLDNPFEKGTDEAPAPTDPGA